MDENLIIIIAILATYRFTYILSRENAPYDLMFKLRYYAEKNDVRFIDLSCFRCTSVYASLPFAIWLSWNNFWYIPIYVLALSGAVTIINFIMDKLDNEL